MSTLDLGERRDPSDAPHDRRGGYDRTEGHPRATFVVHEGAARRALVAAADDLLRQLELEHIRRTVPLGSGAFRRAEAWSPPMSASLREAAELVEAHARSLVDRHPELARPALDLLDVARLAVRADAPLAQVLSAFYAAVPGLAPLVTLSPVGPSCTALAGPDLLEIALDGRGSGEASLTKPAFLAAVAGLHRESRAAGRSRSAAEVIAEQVAESLLAAGVRYRAPYRTWVTSGFRDHQTYMSVTDPGDGHLDGTVRELGHLDGVIVHIEHLERAGGAGRSEVEPYRIPYPPVVARVRLALGEDAPSSSYVGRPVFESDVESGMLKTVHTVAAACSDLFSEGLAECKIAIEGMTATQAIRYMRQLDNAVRRDRFGQVLSAAFNLNTPIVDDREGRGRLVSDRLEVGRLGIALVCAGRFGKVTWDGSGNSYPSGCVLEQLTRAEALTLVHEAHEVGLLTYFSAGFRFHHLADAVFTGADGIGIGGAQILRYMDADNGHHGPFVPGNIGRILQTRDEAERLPRGRWAAMLSRLDRMYFERSITVEDDKLRRALWTAVLEDDEREAELLLAGLDHIASLPGDGLPSLVCWVRRLDAAGAHSLFARTTPKWHDVVARLRRAAENEDMEFLAEQLQHVRARTSQRQWVPSA